METKQLGLRASLKTYTVESPEPEKCEPVLMLRQKEVKEYALYQRSLYLYSLGRWGKQTGVDEKRAGLASDVETEAVGLELKLQRSNWSEWNEAFEARIEFFDVLQFFRWTVSCLRLEQWMESVGNFFFSSFRSSRKKFTSLFPTGSYNETIGIGQNRS